MYRELVRNFLQLSRKVPPCPRHGPRITRTGWNSHIESVRDLVPHRLASRQRLRHVSYPRTDHLYTTQFVPIMLRIDCDQLGTAAAGTANLPSAPAGLVVSISPCAGGGAELGAGERGSACATCGARCSALCERLSVSQWRCNFCGGENASTAEVFAFRDAPYRHPSEFFLFHIVCIEEMP